VTARAVYRTLAVGGCVAMSVSTLVAIVSSTPRASAVTDSATLVGEGGSFLAPVTNQLLNDDTSLGLFSSYSDDNIDDAIADFVGTGPGQFDTDFAVSERPLTTSEAAQATTDGRSFAYIPLAVPRHRWRSQP
jgi:ABC-type phosphate transport system substrate-binding protein